MNLSITQIEDALLALPEYKSVPRASENLRKLTLCIASLKKADYLTLLNFSGYPAGFVKRFISFCKDNDLLKIGSDGATVIAESFVRNRVKGAGRLIDRITGNAPVAAEPSPIPVTAATESEKTRIVKESKSWRILASIHHFCAQGTSFTVDDIFNHLNGEVPKKNIGIKLWDEKHKGTVRQLEVGKRGVACRYIAGDGTPVTTPPKEVAISPAPQLPLNTPSPSDAALITSPIPVAISESAEVLPGPEPTKGEQFIDHLIFLKSRAIGDVEAITRVLGIIEREGAR